MARVLTDNKYYSQIADVIREQNGTSNTYKPPQMVRALKDLFYEEVEGVPPITFQGIGENLLDYRIDGASGGVGARTNNLFDKTKTNRKLNQAKNADGTMNYSTVSSNFFDYYIAVEPNTQYTVTDERYAPSRIYFFKSDKTWIDRSDIAPADAYPKKRVFTTPSNCYYIQFQESKDRMMNENTLMLNVGNISLAYESYYKIPVKINNTNVANIYLDKPIEGKANIPSEYTEVEYIESTGTQYINTNYTPVQGDDLEFKNVTINTFNGALFSAGTESYQLILLGTGSICYYKYFQTGNAVRFSFSTITNGNIKVLNGNLYINNVLKVESDYGGDVNTTLNIFRRADNTSNLIGKIGEIIISNNGIIKRNFIPCYRKSDNVAGLYDLINSTFYTNQGTGNFIVGPIIENESISLSDTNVDIPTIRGTNVLTVDTTVQPNNVYVKARKESQYETIMRERYEEAQAQLDALESE